MPEPYVRIRACERFELVSRGDLVHGLLWHDSGSGRRPLVLVAPAVGSAKDAPEVEALCQALVAAGLVAAAIDLPLQGERASAKLSARLARCASGLASAAVDPLLWREYLRQVACDLDATRAALTRRDIIAPGAVGCAAFEPGAAAALDWAANAPDLRAVQPLTPTADPVPVAASLREQLS